MKKYIYTALMSTGLLFTTSCENDFDAQIYGQLSTTNFPATVADYESYLMDCYIPFCVTWSYNLSGSSMHNFYVSEGGLNRLFDMPDRKSVV